MLNISMYKKLDTGYHIYDGVVSTFNDEYDNNIDATDANKINNQSDNLSIISSGKSLAIERRRYPESGDVIQLGIGQMRVASYKLKINPVQLDQMNNMQAYLEDSYLQTRQPLSLTDYSEYNFDINGDAASYGSERFRIVFASRSTERLGPQGSASEAVATICDSRRRRHEITGDC